MNKVKQKRLFLMCLSTLLAVSFAWAQEEEYLALRSAWGSFTSAKQNAWSQWSTRISNRGDQAHVARVGCLADQAGGGKIVFSRVIPIPPYSTRQTRLVFRPGVPKVDSRQGRGSLQSYILWDDQTGQQIQANTETLSYTPTGTSLFGVLQAGRIDHDEISYVKEDFLRRLLGDIQMTATTRLNCPDAWYGFSPLKIFAMGDINPAEFRTTQFDAVLQWVRGGGCLLLLGGEKLPALLAGPIGQAAGVRGVGVHTVDSLKITNVSGDTKKSKKPMSVTLPWPLPMTELYTLDARVLYEVDGLPLLTLRRVGEGCILTSAVPAGALKPRDEFNPWADVARAQTVKPVLDDNAFLPPARQVLQQIAGRQGPDRMVPTTILVVLLAFALVLGLILRIVRRGEWLWILLVPLGLVVAAGLFYYSLQLGNPQRLSHVGLITGLGDGQARIQQTFAYYSGPEAQEINPTSDNPTGLIANLGRSTTAAMKVSEIRTTADGTILPDLRVEPNGTRALYTYNIESMPILSGSLRFEETGLVGELTNNLSADIENAVLMVNYHTYRVGSIAAGQTRKIQINDGDLLGLVSFPIVKSAAKNTSFVRGKKKNTRTTKAIPVKASEPKPAEGEFSSAIVPDKRQTALVRRLIAQPAFQTEFAGGAKLIGYTSSSGVDPLSGRECQRQGWSILQWPISTTPPKPGRKVYIPAGWMAMNYRAMNWDARHHCFIEVTRDSKVSLAATPPRGIRLKNITADLVVDVRAIDYRMDILGILPGKGQKPVHLKTLERPNGRTRLRIPNADRFLDADGNLVLQLDVSRVVMDLPDLSAGKKSAGKTIPSGVAGAPWLIQRVDVSLKGTVR